MVDIKVQCGKFWVSPKDLPKKEPLGSTMVTILGCQPDYCKDKRVYLKLVKLGAEEILTNQPNK